MAKSKQPKESKRVLPEGTIIGECDCAGCGVRVPLKENSAGGVYYFCARVVDEVSGERCYFRVKLNMSGAGSVDIVMETLASPLARSA